ncbi:acyl-CoA dehydrogenase family protein [Caenimonas soli]|uniref:acyl-CoA dehydrogenase family protein n=1 Tax=Caenimonas soli TaxID=2735555 RepID=UPI001556517D|nr:acyl-CoA dehydrogenase family protein [Caenimonas soli]NPC56407.1 acyl-CoA/acyl-ACP dehydrogenase [Caenimonas soli]
MQDNNRFASTTRERALFEQAEKVAAAHPRPKGRPFDAGELRAIFRELAPTGYLASTLPPEEGRHGLDVLEFSALVEGLSPQLALLGNHSVQRYLHQFASPGQQERFMPSLLEGEGIGAIAMTETHAGSDLERMTTTARRAGDVYVIDGEKTWVTHGLAATMIVVLARSEVGLTRFLVPGDTPGLTREALEPVGLRHLGFARLTFRGCEIPAELRLGAEGEGLKGTKSAFPIARVLAALQAFRIARAALDIARDYAGVRVAARTPLASSSLVQHGLAQLVARCEAVRLLCLKVAGELAGADSVAMASAAKALAGELALDACRWTEDLLGSSSLHASHPLAELSGDARMMAVVDGTSVLNHLVVARRLLPQEGTRR